MSRPYKESRKKPVTIPKRDHQDIQPDFDPADRMKTALRKRKKVDGITIDNAGTFLMDDGINVRKNYGNNSGWHVQAHIADVPALIPEGSILEEQAKLRGDVIEQKKSERWKTDQGEKPKGKPLRIFPADFLAEYVSLVPGKPRPAITFDMALEENRTLKAFNIRRTAFLNIKQCDFSPLQGQYHPKGLRINDWFYLAKRLNEDRVRDLSRVLDGLIGKGARLDRRVRVDVTPEQRSNVLVHEIMRLCSRVTHDFLADAGLHAPERQDKPYISVFSVSDNFDFERTCNGLCWNIVNEFNAGADPYIRLSSPMQKYSDYITMKIMTRHLDGLPPDLALDHESFRLTQIFKESSKSDHMNLVGHAWEKPWRKHRGRQKYRHIFDEVGNDPDLAIPAALDNGVKEKGWGRPDISMRQLFVRGTYMYFAGLQFASPPGMGRDRQAWGVSYSPEAALELASFRLATQILPDLAGGMK